MFGLFLDLYFYPLNIHNKCTVLLRVLEKNISISELDVSQTFSGLLFFFLILLELILFSWNEKNWLVNAYTSWSLKLLAKSKVTKFEQKRKKWNWTQVWLYELERCKSIANWVLLVKSSLILLKATEMFMHHELWIEGQIYRV